MRFIPIATLYVVMLLAACTATPPVTQPIQAEAGGDDSSYAVGTLAPVGSFEWRVAPSYTQIGLAGHSAARSLRKGEISRDTAVRVNASLVSAKDLLNEAVAADALKDVAGSEGLAKAAADAIAKANAILRGEK